MDELLRELIEVVKNTAPELWRIALLQVKAEIISNIIQVVACVIAVLLLVALMKFSLRKYYGSGKSDWERNELWVFGIALSPVIAIFPIFNIVICANAAAMRLVNPEYYAVQVLLSMLPR